MGFSTPKDHIGLQRTEGESLRDQPEERRADKVNVLAAVRHSGLELEFASGELCSDGEVALAALQQNGDAYRFVDQALTLDRDFVLCAAAFHGAAIQHFHDDPEIVLRAVTQNGNALKYASGNLQADKTTVLAAVKSAKHVLRYASSSMRDDKEVVLEAVAMNGLQLESSSDRLKNDLDVVLVAVEQDCRSHEFVSGELAIEIWPIHPPPCLQDSPVAPRLEHVINDDPTPPLPTPLYCELPASSQVGTPKTLSFIGDPDNAPTILGAACEKEELTPATTSETLEVIMVDVAVAHILLATLSREVDDNSDVLRKPELIRARKGDYGLFERIDTEGTGVITADMWAVYFRTTHREIATKTTEVEADEWLQTLTTKLKENAESYVAAELSEREREIEQLMHAAESLHHRIALINREEFDREDIVREGELKSIQSELQLLVDIPTDAGFVTHPMWVDYFQAHQREKTEAVGATEADAWFKATLDALEGHVAKRQKDQHQDRFHAALSTAQATETSKDSETSVPEAEENVALDATQLLDDTFNIEEPPTQTKSAATQAPQDDLEADPVPWYRRQAPRADSDSQADDTTIPWHKKKHLPAAKLATEDTLWGLQHAVVEGLGLEVLPEKHAKFSWGQLKSQLSPKAAGASVHDTGGYKALDPLQIEQMLSAEFEKRDKQTKKDEETMSWKRFKGEKMMRSKSPKNMSDNETGPEAVVPWFQHHGYPESSVSSVTARGMKGKVHAAAEHPQYSTSQAKTRNEAVDAAAAPMMPTGESKVAVVPWYKKPPGSSPQSQHTARIKLRMAAKIAGRMAVAAQKQMSTAEEITDEPDWDNFQPDQSAGPTEQNAELSQKLKQQEEEHADVTAKLKVEFEAEKQAMEAKYKSEMKAKMVKEHAMAKAAARKHLHGPQNKRRP